MDEWFSGERQWLPNSIPTLGLVILLLNSGEEHKKMNIRNKRLYSLQDPFVILAGVSLSGRVGLCTAVAEGETQGK